jgi:hypothetical protein
MMQMRLVEDHHRLVHLPLQREVAGAKLKEVQLILQLEVAADQVVVD